MSMILNPYRHAAAGGPTFGNASRVFSSGNYLYFPAPPCITDEGDFSISAWIYGTTLGANRCALACTNAPTSGVSRILINSRTATSIRAFWDGAYFGETTISQSTWYHVLLTGASDETAELFIDGISQGTNNNSLAANDTNIYIGSGFATQWDGNIANVCVYDRILTGLEITNLAAKVHVSSGLIRQYIGDEDSLSDLTGNGPALTEAGTTTYSTDGPFD